MRETVFEGIFPYLVSPVDEDGGVREEVLRKLVSSLIGAGVHGLTPLGSTGEFFYLTWEQKRRIVEIVIDETAGRVPVVAGVGTASLNEARVEAREFERMGVDGVLSVLNVYFPLSMEAMYSYYAGVAESVSCPIVLYNNPQFTGGSLSLPVLERLCKYKNVRYYKDATGNTGSLLHIVNHLGDRLKIFSASAHVPVFVMMLGGVGWMAGPACVIPKQSVALYNLCKEQRWEEAMALQKRLWQVNDAFKKYNLAACIKAGLELQGFDVGAPVLPNAPLDENALREIRAVLESVAEV